MGQGALGIETRANDIQVINFISFLDHKQTRWAVDAERSLVDTLNGSCQVPIGAYATVDKKLITLRGLVASLDGKTIYRREMIGPVNEAVDIGRLLGNELLKMGADAILKNITQ